MTDIDGDKRVDGSASRREWLVIMAASPLMILLGFHIALLATWIRQRLGVPYILSVSVLMTAEATPLILLRGNNSIWIPAAAIAFVLLLLFAIHALFCHTKEHYLDGRNAEYLIHAHIVLCMMYVLLPAIYEVREASRERAPQVLLRAREHFTMPAATSL